MNKRSSTILLLFMALPLFFLLNAHHAYAATANGHITGQLLDGSNHNAPLAGQAVTLQMAQGSSAQDLRTVTTDDHGSYSFDNLATDKAISYAVYIRYQGAQYVSDIVHLDSNPTQQLNLTVYQATTSSAKLVVRQATMLIHEPDKQKGIITISEAFSFQNLDLHTYVGSLDGSKGKPNALLFTLPPGAGKITLVNGFAGYKVIQVDRGFATDAAVLPGSNDFSFSFEVPYSGSTYDLNYTTQYPTATFSLLVPPDLQVNSSLLKAQGVITAADQHTYRLLNATLLPAHKDLQTSLAGLPALATASAFNPNAIWIIAAIVLMLAVLFSTWFLYRSRRRAVSGKGTRPDPVVTAASSNKDETAEDQRQALLRKLLDLEKAYETGKMSKAAYEEQRSKTRARLRTLMSEQEASHT